MSFSVIKPTVNGSNGSWGSILNTAIDDIVAQINTNISDIAARLTTAGGILTGRLDLKTVTQAHVSVASSGNPVFDLSAADSFDITITGAASPTFTNAPAVANALAGFILRITNGGSAAITWPASVKWPGGSPPALTAAGTDLLVFLSDNQGVTWRGALAASDIK